MSDKEPPIAVQPSSCCSTTEDGNTVCIVPQGGQATSCGCSSSLSDEQKTQSSISIPIEQPISSSSESMGQKLRTGFMIGVACITSPCCTPLIVPLVIALLAGTPIAWWISQNLGLVYGGLTLISIMSAVIVFRRVSKPTLSKSTPLHPTSISPLSPVEGTRSHAK